MQPWCLPLFHLVMSVSTPSSLDPPLSNLQAEGEMVSNSSSAEKGQELPDGQFGQEAKQDT